MKRSKAREKALQAVFQMDLSDISAEEAIINVLEDGEKTDDFLQDVVNGTKEHQAEIDTILKNHLEKWSLDRLGTIDRTILRIATYEMKYVEDIPLNVSMNEAIELAKVFGDDKSSSFINAVLSKVKTSLEK
ncbi:transcription antitermination factor NusB [Sutcliffiella rhizosphaerae]|uniref:Transcription antitermination protein NusB n=1 Tax=Sutcliffiella rhizosphaerae TaxID=2880967 RepID=A0ABN8AJ01_9BACI|nr:transcription antitermination factor NusB [Sutcliffiella rhizosphaerae]CAG9623178.1 Transcription antitermination protein NusB [Sutcliffiella rhizosphaerae]